MSRAVRSAGLLPYRRASALEVLIAHPGGPFWQRRDDGAWSVIKGVIDEDEPDEVAAAREFTEETGWNLPEQEWLPLGDTRLKSGKVVVAWAVEFEPDLGSFLPGTFQHQGREYPEIDRVEWFPTGAARRKLNPAQTVFLDRLEAHLGLNGHEEQR
jgi:predicted NUDIX family NTP pyrophosphohydrolase